MIDVVLPQAKATRPADGTACGEPSLGHPSFSFRLNRKKLRALCRREGRSLLRTNLCGRDHEDLWQFAIQLTAIEKTFKPSRTICHCVPSTTNSNAASTRTS